MVSYGNKVIIKDRSKLHGASGVVVKILDDLVHVLIDQEVIWPVDICDLELLPQDLPKATPSCLA